MKKKWSMLYFGAYQYKYFRENTWELIERDNPSFKTDEYYTAQKTLGTFALGLSSEMFTPYVNALRTFNFSSDVTLVKLQNDYKGIVTYPNLICCDLSESATSMVKRNHVEFMDYLKWYRTYNFTNHVSFPTKRASKYTLLVYTNSYLDPIEVFRDGKKMEYRVIDDRISITFKAEKSKTRFIFKNIFIKKYTLKG
jgi:hypothetical protein